MGRPTRNRPAPGQQNLVTRRSQDSAVTATSCQLFENDEARGGEPHGRLGSRATKRARRQSVAESFSLTKGNMLKNELINKRRRLSPVAKEKFTDSAMNLESENSSCYVDVTESTSSSFVDVGRVDNGAGTEPLTPAALASDTALAFTFHLEAASRVLHPALSVKNEQVTRSAVSWKEAGAEIDTRTCESFFEVSQEAQRCCDAIRLWASISQDYIRRGLAVSMSATAPVTGTIRSFRRALLESIQISQTENVSLLETETVASLLDKYDTGVTTSIIPAVQSTLLLMNPISAPSFPHKSVAALTNASAPESLGSFEKAKQETVPDETRQKNSHPSVKKMQEKKVAAACAPTDGLPDISSLNDVLAEIELFVAALTLEGSKAMFQAEETLQQVVQFCRFMPTRLKLLSDKKVKKQMANSINGPAAKGFLQTVLTFGAILQELVWMIMAGRLSETLAHMVVSTLTDTLVLPAGVPHVRSICESLLVLLFHRCSSFRGSIRVSLTRLAPASPQFRSQPRNVVPGEKLPRPRTSSASTAGETAIHPFTSTLIKIASVFAIPDEKVSAHVFHGLSPLTKKQNACAGFVRAILRDLIDVCLDVSNQPPENRTKKKRAVGTAESRKLKRDFICGFTSDLLEAISDPVYAGALVFLQHMSLILVQYAVSHIDESPAPLVLYLLSQIGGALFARAASSAGREIEIPPLLSAASNACPPLSVCFRCRSNVEENEALRCGDCGSVYHALCTNTERNPADLFTRWYCEACLLRRSAVTYICRTVDWQHTWFRRYFRHDENVAVVVADSPLLQRESFNFSDVVSPWNDESFLFQELLKQVDSELIFGVLLLQHLDSQRDNPVHRNVTTVLPAVDDSANLTARRCAVDVAEPQIKSETASLPRKLQYIPATPLLPLRSALLTLYASTMKLSAEMRPDSDDATAADYFRLGGYNSLWQTAKQDDESSKKDNCQPETSRKKDLSQLSIALFLAEWTCSCRHAGSDTAPLLNREGLIRIWNQHLAVITSSTRTHIILGAQLAAGDKRKIAAPARQAAITALSHCFNCSPTIINENLGVAVMNAIIKALTDAATLVRARALAAFELWWDTLLTVHGKEVIAAFIAQQDDLLPSPEKTKVLVSESSSKSLDISAFGDIAQRGKTTEAEKNAANLLLRVILTTVQKVIAGASVRDESVASRSRAVKLLLKVALALPKESPRIGLIMSAVVKRLCGEFCESKNTMCDIMVAINSLWFQPTSIMYSEKSAAVKSTLLEALKENDDDSSGSSLKPKLNASYDKNYWSVMVTSLMPLCGSRGPSAVPVLQSNTFIERVPKLLEYKKRLAPSSNSTAVKSLTDLSLPPMQQVFLLGLLQQQYTIQQLDRMLEIIIFSLLRIFLSSTDQTASKTSSNTVSLTSSTGTMRVVRLLMEARPVALTDLFLKHFTPYCYCAPRTAAEADLIAELLSIVHVSLVCHPNILAEMDDEESGNVVRRPGKICESADYIRSDAKSSVTPRKANPKLESCRASPVLRSSPLLKMSTLATPFKAATQRAAAELRKAIMGSLLVTGQSNLTESAVACLVELSCRVTGVLADAVEPLLIGCGRLLFPLRNILSGFHKRRKTTQIDGNSAEGAARPATAEADALLLSILNLFTRWKGLHSPSNVQCASLVRLDSEGFKQQRQNKIEVDVTNEALTEKQLRFIAETIRRRTHLLACLCKHLNLENLCDYDLFSLAADNMSLSTLHLIPHTLDDSKDPASAENTADGWEFKTPEPRVRRPSLQACCSENFVSFPDDDKSLDSLELAFEPSRGKELNSQMIREEALHMEKHVSTLPDARQSFVKLLSMLDQAAACAQTNLISIARFVHALFPSLYDAHKAQNSAQELGEEPCCTHAPVIETLDSVSIDLPSSLFTLFLDLYDCAGVLDSLNLVQDSLFLEGNLLQCIGMFLSRQRTYLKSRRCRAAFSGALRSWTNPKSQYAVVQTLAALLSQFEAEALEQQLCNLQATDGTNAREPARNVRLQVSAREAVQPLTVHAQDIAALVRGFTFRGCPLNRNNNDKRRQIHREDPVQKTVEYVLQNGKTAKVKGYVLQEAALQLLGLYVKQGLVNPAVIRGTLMGLVLQPYTRTKAIEILTDAADQLPIDVLLINQIQRLLSEAFINDTILRCTWSATEKNQIPHRFCPKCGCPNPFVAANGYAASLEGAARLHASLLQSSRSYNERYVRAVVEGLCHIPNDMRAVSRTLQGQWDEACSCMGRKMVDWLQQAGLELETAIFGVCSIYYLRWCGEFILRIHYNTVSEVLFAIECLKAVVISERMFFNAKGLSLPGLTLSQQEKELRDSPSSTEEDTINSEYLNEDLRRSRSMAQLLKCVTLKNSEASAVFAAALCAGGAIVAAKIAKAALKQFYNITNAQSKNFKASAPLTLLDRRDVSSLRGEEGCSEDEEMSWPTWDLQSWVESVSRLMHIQLSAAAVAKVPVKQEMIDGGASLAKPVISPKQLLYLFEAAVSQTLDYGDMASETEQADDRRQNAKWRAKSGTKRSQRQVRKRTVLSSEESGPSSSDIALSEEDDPDTSPES